MKQFFLELIQRFLAKTPKFFKYIRLAGIALAIVTGLPAFLEGVGVVLPESIALVANKVVAIAASVGAFIAQLTVHNNEKK